MAPPLFEKVSLQRIVEEVELGNLRDNDFLGPCGETRAILSLCKLDSDGLDLAVHILGENLCGGRMDDHSKISPSEHIVREIARL